MSETAGNFGQSMLEAIMHSAVGGIITINSKGIIHSVNPATQRLFGYTEAELIGNNVSILMAGADRRYHDDYIARHIRTEEHRIIGIGREVKALHRDGSLFPVHLSVSAFEMDGERYFAGIIHDLSARTRLEGEVSRQAALFHAVFDHVPEPLIITDVDRCILHTNPAASRVFGYSASELYGRVTRILYDSEDESLRVGGFAAALQNEGSVPIPIDTRFRRKNGETFSGQLMASVVRGPSGSKLGVLGLIRDLTDQLKQEEGRLRTQQLEAIGQLTGGVAHDFNNLLTIITGNLELLDEYVKDERGLDHCRRAQAAAEAGARLTSRLLTFARRRRLAPQVVDLNEHVMSMTELLKRTLGGNIQLTTRLAPDLWMTLIDDSEIENAILNLAINSRDAMPNGGKLIIETSNAVIDGEPALPGSPVMPGHYVRMSVSDTGTGMPPEVQRRVFEPFFTTKPVGRGTGLGLSTIYGFIKQSNGNVAVYSEIGKGTTVNLYLPRHSGGREELADEAKRPLPVLVAGQTVLVVEDNPEVRAVAVGRLRRLGYDIAEAETAKAAVNLLSQGLVVEAVFSDLVMPGGMSGFDLAHWLDKHRPGLAIVLTSGFSDGVVSGDATRKRAILRKPYTQAELADAMQAAIAEKHKSKA